MKNQEILLTTPMSAAKSSALGEWLNQTNSFFTWVIEESTITNKQVCLMAHASFAFSALVGASFVSAVPALICLCWFAATLFLCVKGGLK